MITTDYMIISLSACIMCVCVRVCMSVCMRMCMRVCWWTRAWVWGGERVCVWKIGKKKLEPRQPGNTVSCAYVNITKP